MIAKAKAISHGINDIRYITGESHNKKHPEKIYRVLDNMMPSEPDAMGVWNSMQLTLSRFRSVKNSVIRIELSPSPEHTKDFTIEDWQKLWQDFATEFDKQVFKDKDGKVRNCPTNLANSKYTVWLHMESNSGVPHLHAAVCRMDEDGQYQQRPQYTPSCSMGSGKSGKETWMDNSKTGKKCQHAICYTGLYECP